MAFLLRSGLALTSMSPLAVHPQGPSPEQQAAAVRLEQGETQAALTRVRQELAACLAESTRQALAHPACPEPVDSAAPAVSAASAIPAILLFGIGFALGFWWCDWRQRQRHGGFRV